MASPRGNTTPSPWPPLFFFILLIASLRTLHARPLLLHSSINVAVVFSGSSYQSEVRGRLSGENFVDLPVVVSPVTVLVNDTNPRDLLTRLCDTMATEKLHGVVFEDDVGSGASTQVSGHVAMIEVNQLWRHALPARNDSSHFFIWVSNFMLFSKKHYLSPFYLSSMMS